VISPEQVSISILQKGIKDSAFNFSFNNRDNEGILIDLGLTIANIASVTPGGMLIFFPSYKVMVNCEELWNYKGVKQEIEMHKKLFLEPKDPSKY
jgi:Rad3-related DNA helicase